MAKKQHARKTTSTTTPSTTLRKIAALKLPPATVDWGDGPHDLWEQLLFHLGGAVPLAKCLWETVSTGPEALQEAIIANPQTFVWDENVENASGLLISFGVDFQIKWLVEHNVPMALWPERTKEAFYRAIDNETLRKEA